MKCLLCMALAGAATTTMAQTDAAPNVSVRAAASSPASSGSSDNFTGAVRITSPFQALSPGKAGGATVTFEPRARTAWHTHPLGQTLVVTAGLGLVQQQGQPALVIRPGDVVTIPANVRHWHGAGPGGAMSHVAIAGQQDGSSARGRHTPRAAYSLAARAPAGLAPSTHEGSWPPARTWPASETLSPRQRAIPLIGAAMAASDMPRLHSAVNQGLDAGLTLGEAKEVLVQLYAYAGFPRSLNALGELMKAVEARRQRGIQDAPGTEPSRAVVTGVDLLAAGKANQTEISGGAVQGAVFDFAPAINQFLQAHLFGDIFERDNLDWQSRELATVGALAATPGAEAQLRSHMRASLRVGLTAAQLQQLVRALAEHGDASAATRAAAALSEALVAASKG